MLTILGKLSGAAMEAGDLLEAFLESGYGASQSTMARELRAVKRRREKGAEEWARYTRLQRRYYNAIAWLKQDGLITDQKSDQGRILQLTRKGMQKFIALKDRQKNALPEHSYRATASNSFVIVAFDVPEKERRKRDWLRDTLRYMGLHMLQESVWIGKVVMPKDFIDDLRTLRLLEYVEIFEITRAGSLRHVV